MLQKHFSQLQSSFFLDFSLFSFHHFALLLNFFLFYENPINFSLHFFSSLFTHFSSSEMLIHEIFCLIFYSLWCSFFYLRVFPMNNGIKLLFIKIFSRRCSQSCRLLALATEKFHKFLMFLDEKFIKHFKTLYKITCVRFTGDRLCWANGKD